MNNKPSQNSNSSMVRDALSAPDDAILTCTSLDCPERKSVCCDAHCTNGKGKTESAFVCSKCRKTFREGECTAVGKPICKHGNRADRCEDCEIEKGQDVGMKADEVLREERQQQKRSKKQNCTLCQFENGYHSWECPRKKENWCLKVHDLLDEYGYGKGSKERSKLLALTARLHCFIIGKEK